MPLLQLLDAVQQRAQRLQLLFAAPRAAAELLACTAEALQLLVGGAGVLHLHRHVYEQQLFSALGMSAASAGAVV
jgi:hypothetical protein